MRYDAKLRNPFHKIGKFSFAFWVFSPESWCCLNLFALYSPKRFVDGHVESRKIFSIDCPRWIERRLPRTSGRMDVSIGGIYAPRR